MTPDLQQRVAAAPCIVTLYKDAKNPAHDEPPCTGMVRKHPECALDALLRPVCDWCRGTGVAESKKYRLLHDVTCEDCNGTGRREALLVEVEGLREEAYAIINGEDWHGDDHERHTFLGGADVVLDLLHQRASK